MKTNFDRLLILNTFLIRKYQTMYFTYLMLECITGLSQKMNLLSIHNEFQ